MALFAAYKPHSLQSVSKFQSAFHSHFLFLRMGGDFQHTLNLGLQSIYIYSSCAADM